MIDGLPGLVRVGGCGGGVRNSRIQIQGMASTSCEGLTTPLDQVSTLTAHRSQENP